MTQGGRRGVAAQVQAGREAIARKKQQHHDPAPMQARGGANPGQWTPNEIGLPTEDVCPVEPLGLEGGTYHVIDSNGQFRSLSESEFTHAGIQSLFAAAPHYPEWAWPRWTKPKVTRDGEVIEPPKIDSFKDDLVRKSLFRACARLGLFSPSDKLRGRGGWLLAETEELVYHAGDEVYRFDGGRMRAMGTGMHQGHLYPRLAALPAPWPEAIAASENPARALLQAFRCWNWEKPDVDPVLLLGWIGVAYLGGALHWRSAVALIGGFGTGKSTLQKGLRSIFGEALFHSADTTAAGIYQRMGHDARPCAIDELEADADSRKVDQVVKLMRAASSGDMSRRGGSDHHAVEFSLNSAFLFSAVNNPLQAPQDLSRIALLRLRELNPDQAPPPPINTETAGRMVLAQLMRNWSGFAERFAAYSGALAAAGHNARGRDTYGVLLACADILLGPELAEQLGVPLTEDLAFWTQALGIEMLPEVQDTLKNWHNCLQFLLTARVPAWRSGMRATVGQLLKDYAEKVIGYDAANEQLGQAGLAIFEDPARGTVLAVPNQSQIVGELFAGSPFQGSPGAGGPWKDALRQEPTGRIVFSDRTRNRVSVNGVQVRCTLVAMREFHKMLAD